MSLMTNLERYYKLNGDGIDSIAGQNAVLTGITWATGHVGLVAADVNADTSRGIVAPGLNLMTDISVQVWVRITPSIGGAYHPIICNMDGSGATATNWAILDTGGYRSYAFMGTGNSFSSCNTGALSTGVWHHIVMTRTTGGSIRVYVNGALTANSPGSGPAPYSVPLADLRIGCREDNYASFPGAIEQVGVWSRILSAAEVTELYNGGDGLFFGALIPAPPTITVVSPSSGTTAGGTPVVVLGTSLNSGTLKFGGSPATDFFSVSDTRVVAATPPGAAGAADVTFTDPYAQTGTLVGGYTYGGTGGGGGTPNTPPTVTNVTPVTGSSILPTQYLQFDVTDAEGLLRVSVLASFADGTYDVVYDGDAFAPKYSGSYYQAISGGYRFYVAPNGGWRLSPTLRVIAADTGGAEFA